FVLLGEATHGTREFYQARAHITRRLIEEKGFTAVAIEGNWTNAARVNRYALGTGTDTTAEQALSDFVDFPRWMWRNTDVRDLVEWLRSYNLRQTPERQAGIYGLDLYGFFDSAKAAVQDLEDVAPWIARRARVRYQCFEQYTDDPQWYGNQAVSNGSSCEDEAQRQLQEIEQLAVKPRPLDRRAETALFSAIQNARVVKNGETYFRALYDGSQPTWNLRDLHMVETLEEIAEHAGMPSRPGKVVAWAHNTHMGDVRATQFWESGQINVGQLMRERHEDEVVLVGFTTYTGTVMAASEWDMPGERTYVLPALPESDAGLFHSTGRGDFMLTLRDQDDAARHLAVPRLQRAIGVVYLPQSERFSHYFDARLSQQFDAVLHFDETEAVEPLQP
ncbi:MAG TPA: erythromycin esterase family protein, partial [Herpetosiphonaceae bacterium]|nr:erythromycin esterase family protein [Herpetosiphonaceae bacterium]